MEGDTFHVLRQGNKDMETATTAREQFIEDYLLVTMNDQPSYNYISERLKALEVDELATELESEFEEMVSDITANIDESARLLIRQMLMNQGMDTWHQLAREITERFVA